MPSKASPRTLLPVSKGGFKGGFKGGGGGWKGGGGGWKPAWKPAGGWKPSGGWRFRGGNSGCALGGCGCVFALLILGGVVVALGVFGMLGPLALPR